ncbi:hypothetical protein MSAN_01105400 [Mycena sanguinolenta]|uniref:RING-type domain-containing protein n=1 Tax=Mycena sanguinolenta TaxID=230812 RepID=A0A8H6YNM0_9AGAR|nr:hypothetical protein MSAN_01105400 [Mycena sanguinolenta]
MSIQSKLCWHTAAHNDASQLGFTPRGLLMPAGAADGEICECAAPCKKKGPNESEDIQWYVVLVRHMEIALNHRCPEDDHGGDDPLHNRVTRIIFKGPPSLIIGDLPGLYTAPERTARVRIIQEQRAGMEAEAGLARMVGQVALLAQLTEFHDRRRTRARIDQKDAESRAAYRRLRAARPPAHKIRILYPGGKRAQRERPLSVEDLYLTEARPQFLDHPLLLHTCSLCLNAKSHPVKLQCGHSACYVCVSMELEINWVCNRCGQKITKAPKVCDEEAREIDCANPGWDASKVTYSWEGLNFPSTRLLTLRNELPKERR